MARGLVKVLIRVRALAAQEKVRFTLKAIGELAALGLDARDACETPCVGATSIYLKLILRDECLVVSFHEDEYRDDE